MVYMPHDDQGKNRKLALPYHGPLRILEVLPNCLATKPVDRPDDPAIKINMDHVMHYRRELSRGKEGAKKENQPKTKEPNHPGTHSYNLRERKHKNVL